MGFFNANNILLFIIHIFIGISWCFLFQYAMLFSFLFHFWVYRNGTGTDFLGNKNHSLQKEVSYIEWLCAKLLPRVESILS